MGCDVHGFLELYHPEFKRWVAFKEVDQGRSYRWFGILSGVRGDGPHVESEERGPDIDFKAYRSRRRDLELSGREEDDEEYSRAWVEYCKSWGSDLHSHTVVPYREIMAANVRKWEMDKQMSEYDDNDDEEKDGAEDPPDIEKISMEYYQEVPGPDFIVEEIVFDTQWDEERQRQEPMRLPMNLPLCEIVGTRDLSEVVRMVVAYDN
jgi:hypothetical protein